jgi:DNA-directed RNA polymerase subunit H (RpoH/RPB5)
MKKSAKKRSSSSVGKVYESDDDDDDDGRDDDKVVDESKNKEIDDNVENDDDDRKSDKDEEDEEEEEEEEETETEEEETESEDEESKKKSSSKKSLKKSSGGGDPKLVQPKKTSRLSAATLKTRMMSSMLQNPVARKKIWLNVQQMMVRRGYEWVADRAPPTDYEQLLPNNKGLLGFFHMHAVDKTQDPTKKREPVYVAFCSKAGEPTLTKLTYPSRHIIVVSDSLTGRARAALQALPLKAPPLANTISTTNSTSPTTKETLPPTSAAITKKGQVVPPPMILHTTNLREAFVEAFTSSFFMFDLLKQRYLKVVEFSPISGNELENVFQVFERKRDISRFPRMVESDPVVRYLRLAPLSIIKQKRLSTSAATQLSYRVVVKEIKS